MIQTLLDLRHPSLLNVLFSIIAIMVIKNDLLLVHAVTCLTSGCTYQSLGCTYNNAWQDLDCMYRNIEGTIYVNNIPAFTKNVFLKGNPNLKKIDARTYENSDAKYLLDDSCPSRGCSYKFLKCIFFVGIKTLNCANRGIIGNLYINDVPTNTKSLRLENNYITNLSPLMFFEYDKVETFGGLITGVTGVIR